ncbi:MAG: FAD-binding oxidoreductase [Alphaproteobacteria bacterium]|nr:FAD-binding oxidoreductase [Alphaproteobacteria bacterium]
MSDRASLSRRNFIATSAALGAGLAGGGTAGYLLGRHEAEAAAKASARAWAQLAKLVRVVRPWDDGFEQLILPNNLRYAGIVPQGVARVRNSDEIAKTIHWCREHRMPLVTRGGGHSYAGFSTTRGLMIDTTLMSGALFDASTGRVTVQGGVLNGQIYDVLREHNVAITHGRCPSVGGAGFLLGGGIGFNMRENGLGCDQLTASAMVKADGNRVTMKPGDDLFWASQGGGGGNFGVSTSFTLQTFAVPALITVFRIVWRKQPERIAAALVKALEAAPASLGSRISLGAVTRAQQAAGLDVTVNLLGQFKGPAKQLEQILAPVNAIARPAPGDETINETSYWQGQDFLHEDQPPIFYQERSAFVNRALSDQALALGIRHLREWPGTEEYCDLRFFQTGGAMNAKASTDTAFVHRKSRWLMVVGLYWAWEDNRNLLLMARNHAWQDEFYRAMLPFAGGGAYQNFADPGLKDWRSSYYGGNFDRLARIKRAVDPDSVFSFPQAV